MLIVYARISKADGSQSLDLQRDALREAGVSDDAIYEDQASGQREDRPGLATAAAIHNLTGSDLVVTCRLMKDGAGLEETQIPLAANGQEARYIEEMFTFTDVSDFVGSVRCTVPPGRQCSPESPWSWMLPTASSPPCRWCRSRERRILRNRRHEGPDSPVLASGDGELDAMSKIKPLMGPSCESNHE